MNSKIKKMNNYFLSNTKKVFWYTFFLIAILSFASIYFLFATISYKYAVKENDKKLNLLLVQNSNLRVKNFEIEEKNYKKYFNDDLVMAKNIYYLKTDATFAVNYNK